MAQLPYPPNVAHFDANQVPTIMGVIGTLGTADTGGTALSLPVGVNPATGAMYVQDLSGASGTTNIQGSVSVTSGTINVGTFVIPSGTLTTGSISDVAKLYTGTINVGTFVMPSGTITTGSLTNIASLSNGSIVMTVGTLTTGTLQNLVTGTLNALAAGTITAGTLTNLVSGTLNALASGTISGGTLQNLNAGTIQVNMAPVIVGTSYGTVGTTGAAVWGTLVAASGAGTKQYVSGLTVVVTSGTVDCAITNIGVGGSTGNGVLLRGQYIAGGGQVREFNPVMASGTNGTISFWMGGAGTASFLVNYWNGV